MEKDWLRAAQKGDPAAFERLVTPYEQALWRLCWHYLRNQEDAQDCLQETMLKAWRSLPKYREEAGLETWLSRIAVNTCLDALRKRNIRQADSLEAMEENTGFTQPDDGPGPEERAIRREDDLRLQAALDALPEEMRSALILFAMEQKSYEEIAEILRVAPGTVKSRIARARQKIKDNIQKWEQMDSARVQKEERRAKA